LRSAGGWSEVLSMRKRGERQFSDERILGSGAFVEKVIGGVEAAQKDMVPLRMRRTDASELVARKCTDKGLSLEALQAGSRTRGYSAIRRELAVKFVLEMGLSHADVAWMLGISRAGVSMLVRG
jgi:putative transposase